MSYDANIEMLAIKNLLYILINTETIPRAKDGFYERTYMPVSVSQIDLVGGMFNEYVYRVYLSTEVKWASRIMDIKITLDNYNLDDQHIPLDAAHTYLEAIGLIEDKGYLEYVDGKHDTFTYGNSLGYRDLKINFKVLKCKTYFAFK